MSKRDRRRRGDDTSNIDPATFFGPTQDVRAERKTQQLCKEVERTLSCALAAASDDVVRDLTLIEVSPAPDASRLLVTLSLSRPVPIDEVNERLERMRGSLRQEIASSLQRKRTPELSFAVVPPYVPGDDEELDQ
jgi:ribosome-binding factor A